MERVYLDTSFFIGLLEDQSGRRESAMEILKYERGNDRFTSQLTLNEFMVRVYDAHKHDPECEKLVDQVETKIRSIARVVGISDEVARHAALLQSRFGEIHKHATPKEPRYRGFRWDAIHLATAKAWRCHRVYAWDGKWEKLPESLKEGMGEIYAPARLPGLLGVLTPPPIDAVDNDSTEVSDPSSEPPQPSEQSPSAPPASASQPEPSPPSAPLDGPELPQQPEEDLPAPVPAPEISPPSPSAQQQADEPGS